MGKVLKIADTLIDKSLRKDDPQRLFLCGRILHARVAAFFVALAVMGLHIWILGTEPGLSGVLVGGVLMFLMPPLYVANIILDTFWLRLHHMKVPRGHPQWVFRLWQTTPSHFARAMQIQTRVRWVLATLLVAGLLAIGLHGLMHGQPFLNATYRGTSIVLGFAAMLSSQIIMGIIRLFGIKAPVIPESLRPKDTGQHKMPTTDYSASMLLQQTTGLKGVFVTR